MALCTNCVSMSFLVGELRSHLQLVSPQLLSSWATRATQQQLEWTLLHPSHSAKHIPSEQSLPTPSRKIRYLLCFSTRCHPPEPLSQLHGRDLSLPFLFAQSFVPGELLLEAPPSPASALAVPSIPLPIPSGQGLCFSSTTCKARRLISD